MEIKDFEESNSVMLAPKGMENCGDLPTYRDGQHTVSRWEPTEEERRQIAAGGSVWLWVWSPVTQPPVSISGISPFASSRYHMWEQQQGKEDIITCSVCEEIGEVPLPKKGCKGEPE